MLGVKWWAGSILAGAMAAMLCWVIQGDKISQTLPGGEKAKTSIADIGRAFIADWVVPFEVMAVLLTAALIGAVVIALEEIMKRR